MYEINSDSFAIEREEAFAEGIAKGRAKGIAEGRAEFKERITTGLLDHGFDLNAISDLTGIELSELERMTSRAC